MKKILVNASLFIITVIAIFGFKTDVNAAAAACEAIGITDSNKCRVTADGRVIIAADDYQNIDDATTTEKENVSTAGRYAGGIPTNYFSDIGVSAPWNRYMAYRDTYRILFCLDAQHEGDHELYVSRFLLDTSFSAEYKAFDVAVMDVLINSDGSILNTLNQDTASEYVSKLLAIRALGYVFGFYFVPSNPEYTSLYQASFTTIDDWLTYSSTYYDELNSTLQRVAGRSLSPRSTFQQFPGKRYSGAPVDTARSYFYDALQAANEYLLNLESNNSSVDAGSVAPIATDVTVDQRPEGNYVEKDVTHTILVSGLANNGDNTFTINGIEFTDGIIYDGLLEAQITSIQIGNNTPITNQATINNLLGENLLSSAFNYDFTNTTEIKITVHFGGYETAVDDTIETLNCAQSPIKYYIDGTYSTNEFGEYSDYIGIIWYSPDYNPGRNMQRFVSIEAGSSENTGEGYWSSSYETYLIDACDCDDLIEACAAEAEQTGNLSGTACQELLAADCGECAELEIECNVLGDQAACQRYGAVCDVACGTDVDTFECCDNQNNLIISAYDNHTVNVSAPYPNSEYACFVSQIDGQVDANGDDAASTVEGAEDDEGNSYTLDQNRYCVVSCKEDYTMTMPTAKLVNAGRYFTFSAAVEGTKTCYTNSIDIDLYNQDVTRIIQEMQNAFNEYNKYKTAIDTFSTSAGFVSKYANYRGGCGYCAFAGYVQGITTNLSYTTYTFHLNTSGTLVTVDRVTSSTDTYNFELDYEFDSVDQVRNFVENGSGWRYLQNDGGSDGGCTCCQCCGPLSQCPAEYTSVPATPGQYTSDLATSLTAYRDYWQGVYEDLVAELEDLQAQYEDCSNDSWTSEMNYNTTNAVSGSPYLYYDYDEDYLADFYNNHGQMTSYLNSEYVDDEWYCQQNALSGSYDDSGCSSTTSYTDMRVNYVTCNLNTGRCSQSATMNLPTVQYVKKTSGVDVSYRPSTLFYNIYPSGEITDTADDDNVALENGLPVALNTERGIYRYTINVTDLGEYYNQADINRYGDSGRLIGADTAVINENDYDFVEGDTAHYTCSYLVNMGITDQDYIVCDWDNCTGDNCNANCIGPNCNNTCEGDDCIADCIGAGCIYDADAGTSLIERVVSLTNLFPNGTNSYNWNRDENAKAEATIDEIQSDGNSIYDEDPILSVTLTPSVTRAIKNYNDEAEGHGGYSNDTLICYAMGSYEEIACYSEFISGLIRGNISYGNINYINNADIVNDRSLIMGNNYRTVRDDNTSYFTTWTTGISADDMIGPSWK